MCFSRARWLACKAGAAVVSGRMFPVLLSIANKSSATASSYAQSMFHDQAAFQDAFSNCLYSFGVRALAVRLEET